MINIDSFVINIDNLNDIPKNSVGIIKALNGQCAIVYFVGVNETVRVDFNRLKEIDVSQTGKGFDSKICNICHILKDTSEFDVNQTDAKGGKTTRPSCKQCRQDIDGSKLLSSEQTRMNREKPPEYSIFVCPICDKRSIVGITARLVRDHDHKTGLGREWICDSCNTGLGRFKDNVDFLQKVIDYLNKFSK